MNQHKLVRYPVLRGAILAGVELRPQVSVLQAAHRLGAVPTPPSSPALMPPRVFHFILPSFFWRCAVAHGFRTAKNYDTLCNYNNRVNFYWELTFREHLSVAYPLCELLVKLWFEFFFAPKLPIELFLFKKKQNKKKHAYLPLKTFFSKTLCLFLFFKTKYVRLFC